jgi:hypothetical protein
MVSRCKHGHDRRCRSTQKRAEQQADTQRSKARRTEPMSLVTRTPLALEIGHRALTNRVSPGHVCRVAGIIVQFYTLRAQSRTYGREAATGPHLNLPSVKKIKFGNCRPIVLACSAITNIWQPSYNSFSDKQLAVMACDRSVPPVGLFCLPSQFPPRPGTPSCNSPPALSILSPPSCDVPFAQGSPAHSCPGPWRLGRFFFPMLLNALHG